jgi:hypothetical protein
MGQLIKDSTDPALYRDVQVDKIAEREVLLTAKSSKKPVETLLNGILELVFSKKELADSCRLGMCSRKGEKGPPLNQLKVSAVKGKYIYIYFLILH